MPDHDLELGILIEQRTSHAVAVDAYRPRLRNGRAVIVVPNQLPSQSDNYRANPIDDTGGVLALVMPLTNAGYTVFVSAARPADHPASSLEILTSITRFVRTHGDDFGIRADRLGAITENAGRHPALMLGIAEPDRSDVHNESQRVSGRLQCVVLFQFGHVTPNTPTTHDSSHDEVDHSKTMASIAAHGTPDDGRMLFVDASDASNASREVTRNMMLALNRKGIVSHTMLWPGASLLDRRGINDEVEALRDWLARCL